MDNNTTPVKILVIDDEASIRQSFANFLEDLGFAVLTAENGRIGLELIEQEKPQMVLVDLHMPELDGLELLKRSREFAPDIPKIVISGVDRISDAVKAIQYGAWDYLIKPVNDMSILEHTIKKALEKARLIQENRTYQKHLEELVLERTLELEQANKHLSNINTRLKKIVETTQGLSGCVEMNRFGSQILKEFAHHMAATGGSLYLVEEGGLRLMHSLDPGHAPDFIDFPLPGHSILKKVIENGQPLLLNNVSKSNTIEPSGWTGYKGGSLLAFPIPDSSGTIVGALTLHNKNAPPFIEQDKEIGAILASYSYETLRAVQAFEALQKSEKQYRTLFEKTNDAIFIVEKKTGRYLDANAAAAKLTGRTIEELRQLTTNDVTPEGADKRLLAITKTDGTRELGTVTYARPDNTCRIASFSTVPLDKNAVIGIARDITHDLEVEKQLGQSQKMEAIGTLAGGIAHDFNNILSGIFGYIQLAKMDLGDSEKLNKHMGQITKGAQRATKLVQQILTFSRQTEHKKNSLKLFLIVKEAIKFLRSSMPATIEIQEKVSSRATVLADPTQAHQVVMNLCTNAYQAMCDSGGTLTVELIDIEITPEDQLLGNTNMPGNYVKLEVRDTGHGMDKKTLERIFDPYFTTKQLEKGTGMGLAVVDGIVNSHNGFIKTFSEIGCGTTFQVFLPIIGEKESPGIQGKTQTGLPEGTEQIMLVDDEENILNVLKIILKKQGYGVTTFKDGLSAFQAFTKTPEFFDLVITDMTMPQMTGDKLSAGILNIRKNMPIILCTGYSKTFTEEMAKEIGISEYVLKPIRGMALSVLIRELLDNSRAKSGSLIADDLLNNNHREYRST